MAVTEVTITGKYVRQDGTTPATGTIQFTLSDPLQEPDSGFILAPFTQTATLDGTGSFSITLAATDDVDSMPDGVSYSVTERVEGAHRQFSIILPYTDTSVDWTTVVPALAAAAAYNYALVPYVDEGDAETLATSTGRAVAFALVFGG